MSERLQKLIANAGYGSRRWAERLIEQGRVTLNNHDVKLGDKAVLNDKIRIDGKLIDLKRYAEAETKVLILNKQAGFICSTKDAEGRKSVFDLLPENNRWVMVGRLDLNTSGLLLFSNNGELANKLMHPSTQIDREYAVRVLGKVKEEHINREIQKEVNPFLVNAPKAVSASKKLVRDLSTKIDQKTIKFTVDALADVWENPEAIEGINAFFEKRKPNWLKEK